MHWPIDLGGREVYQWLARDGHRVGLTGELGHPRAGANHAEDIVADIHHHRFAGGPEGVEGGVPVLHRLAEPEDIPVEQGTVAAAGVDGIGNNDLHAHAERRQRGGQGSGAQPNRGARVHERRPAKTRSVLAVRMVSFMATTIVKSASRPKFFPPCRWMSKPVLALSTCFPSAILG